MNASTRKARNITKNRIRDAKRPTGTHTLTSWLLQAGINPQTATGVAGALRSKLKSHGVTPAYTGRTFVPPCGPTGKPCYRYTKQQTFSALLDYSPRGTMQINARTKALNFMLGN